MPPHMGVSFHVRIGAYNDGNGPSGAFTVQWWLSTSAPSSTCTWNVAPLPAHGGRILECDYTPGGWNNAYPSMVVVDSGYTFILLEEAGEGLISRANRIAGSRGPVRAVWTDWFALLPLRQWKNILFESERDNW
jgi:hypothetical protein